MIHVIHILKMNFIPGHKSFRLPDQGSYFIQEFCEQLESLREIEDLVSIMTNVAQKVSQKWGYSETLSLDDCRQIPVIRSTLNKKIYF